MAIRRERQLYGAEPPNLDRNEITDKGYINQRAVLENRAGLIDKLYSNHPDVIVVT